MKKNLFTLVASFVFTCFILISCNNIESRIDRCFSFAGDQLKKTAETENDTSKFPVNTTPDGLWVTTGMRGWTSGFFPGCLWFMYDYSSDDTWKELAVKWTAGLEEIKNYTGNHDVGFMIYNSYGNGYRLTENPAYKEVILQAAGSLATRYNPEVKSIMSWNPRGNWKFPVIVDNMMNLELLFWASKNGGSGELFEIAENHALTTAGNHVRDDGSTFHVVDYDPETGKVRGKYTAQGYADDSCWSRGQAWGLYGFTVTYRETENAIFLETAKKIADYFVDNLPEDHVPYWDFNAPDKPNEKRDTSAAAIAASGLLELEILVNDKNLARKYHRAALNILNSLSSPPYLAEDSNSSGILLHGVASIPGGNAVDVSLIYGDYYFLEALLRLKRGI